MWHIYSERKANTNIILCGKNFSGEEKYNEPTVEWIQMAISVDDCHCCACNSDWIVSSFALVFQTQPQS
jgi:hypothetical protein